MIIKHSSTNKKIPLIRDKKGIQTVQKMLETSADLYGSKAAYSIPRNGEIYSLTFSEVYDISTKFAYYLESIGLKKNDNIAILGDNCPEWAISYFSVNWIGSVSVPLDARANIKDIINILKFSDSKAIITSEKFINDIKENSKDFIKPEYVISMESILELNNIHDKNAEKIDSNDDDLIDILFTSGTTGNPKGVMLTNRNIMSNVEDIYSFLHINPGDTTFSILPIHHSYERTCGILAPFYSGAHVFFARSIKPREMLADLKTAKPTVWLNAPLLLEKLFQRIQKTLRSQTGIKKVITKLLPKKLLGKKIRKELGLDNIRLIVCGGAALPSWVSEGLTNLGFPIIQGYGLSETSPLISANPPSNPKNESVGMIIDSDEVVIKNQDNEGNGEIWVKGPNIMKGYYKNEEATKEILQEDDWLKTGDIGYFDEQGFLYITGRQKSVIVTKGGKNIHPEEIEEKLTKLDTVEEAIVFSPDDEKIQAIIFPSFEEFNLDQSELSETDKNSLWNHIDREIRTLNKDMESYKRISEFALTVEELPKTTTRKVKRFLFDNVSISKDTKYVDI